MAIKFQQPVKVLNLVKDVAIERLGEEEGKAFFKSYLAAFKAEYPGTDFLPKTSKSEMSAGAQIIWAAGSVDSSEDEIMAALESGDEVF